MHRINNNNNNIPTVIEDEPSHEIYANLIGKKVTDIITQPSSTSLLCNNTSSSEGRGHRQAVAAVPAALPLSPTVIPNKYDDDSDNNDNIDNNDSHPTNKKLRNSNSPENDDSNHKTNVQVYKRAFSSNYNAPTLSQLSLNHKNKGFQLLTKMGFHEKEGGLGRHRQGRLTPMKTILKFDRRGLGSGKKKEAKVTHRLGDDNNGKKNNGGVNKKQQNLHLTKSERKRLAKLERNKEQMKAKKARMMISSVLDDKYGVFLGL